MKFKKALSGFVSAAILVTTTAIVMPLSANADSTEDVTTNLFNGSVTFDTGWGTYESVDGFADAKAGDVLKITCSEVGAAGYHQVVLKNSSYDNFEAGAVNANANSSSYLFLNENDAKTVKAGFIIGGYDCTVTAIDHIPISETDDVWSGTLELDTTWGTYEPIDGYANAKAGNIIKIDCSAIGTADYHQALLKNSSYDNFEAGGVPVTANSSGLFMLNENDAKTFQSGSILGGYDCTLTKIEILTVGKTVVEDTTEYADQTLTLPAFLDETLKLAGKFNVANVNGPNAYIEIEWTSSDTNSQVKLVDNKYGTIAAVNGSKNAGAQVSKIKLADITDTMLETMWINTWNGASIESVTIHNDKTKGNVYTEPILVDSISFADESIEVAMDNEETGLYGLVTVLPEDAADKNIMFASDDTEIVAVNQYDGLLTPVKTGTATVTVTATGRAGKTDTIEVIVTNPVRSISIPAKQSVSIAGDPIKLTVTKTLADPEQATTDTAVVAWSVKSGDAVEIATDGSITPKKVGEAVVTATLGELTADCTVTVTGIPAEEIELDEEAIELEVGGEKTLTATVKPSNTTDSVVWSSSDEDVATVEDGVVTAVSTGSAVITAKAGSVEATCDVTVKISATGVEIRASKTSMIVGEDLELSAALLPANTTDTTPITWSSSEEEVATIDENGKLTALKAGKTTVTATAGNFTDEVEITVSNEEIHATAITLDKEELALEVDDTATLKATTDPKDSTDTITWTSSDEDVATVDNKGNVTAVGVGSAVIKAATSETVKAECAVEVSAKTIAITRVNLDKTTASVEEGATVELTATVSPADTTEDKTVTWTSSDETVATVKDGVVTAVKAGNATITATAGTKSAKCEVTVTAKKIAITEVTLDKTTASVEEGKTVKLTATVLPADTTENKTVTWTSSDETVATVKDGVVTAVKAGKATITATAGTKSATCEATVTAKTIAITDVTLDKTTASVEEGKTVELTATVAPADATEDKTVTWTSSDTTVATVKDGVVTAVKAGKATITATVGTKTATCAVTVTAAEDPTKPEQPTASDVLWEGNKSTGNWADYVQIEATELSEGDKIVVTLTPAANAQISLKNPTGNWDPLPGFAEIANQYGVVDITAGTSAFEYTLTAKDAEAISANGLVVGGQYYTVTKVERVAGTATAPTGYETGKVEVVSDYVPKTAGTQLIVRSITKAEAAQNESYTITVTDSNGKKTTVTTNDCYKAFKYNTANGERTETAANGYFIIVKVTGVPAGTTVDVDIQPTK